MSHCAGATRGRGSGTPRQCMAAQNVDKKQTFTPWCAESELANERQRVCMLSLLCGWDTHRVLTQGGIAAEGRWTMGFVEGRRWTHRYRDRGNDVLFTWRSPVPSCSLEHTIQSISRILKNDGGTTSRKKLWVIEV